MIVVVFGIDRHRTGILLTYSIPSQIGRAAAHLLPWLMVRGEVYVESACMTALDDVNDIISFQRSDRTNIVSVVSNDRSDGRPRGKVGSAPTAGVMEVSAADPKKNQQHHQTVLKRHHHHLHDFRSIPKPTKRPRLDLLVPATASSSVQHHHHHLEFQTKKPAVRFRSLMRPAVDTPIAAGPVPSESRPDDAARVGCCFDTPGSAVPTGIYNDEEEEVHAAAAATAGIGMDEEMDDYAVKTLFPSITPALDRRRAGPTHQWSAPSKEGENAAAAATTKQQWSSLSSLSWVLDHELLRYKCLKNSAKCFSVPPRPGASSSSSLEQQQQVERCDRVYMRSAVMMMLRALHTTEDVSSEALLVPAVPDDVLLVLEDPLTHIKRHAVVDPELFRWMVLGNDNYGQLSDGDSSAIIAAAAAARASSSNLLQWEGSRWNVALSRCSAAADMRSSSSSSSEEEGAMAVLSALSYDELSCGGNDDGHDEDGGNDGGNEDEDGEDDVSTAVHLTWRVVWMDRVT